MKNIIILTADSLRHDFLRKALSLDSNICVLKSYCETSSQMIYSNITDKLQLEHLRQRDQSERDFFGAFVALTPDNSNPCFIAKNEINNEGKVREITQLNPDLIIAYGCSIIKPPLIEAFRGRILNVHLGLSPYYRGSGTNYFPFVNNELEFVGATFMYMDEGIDTGEIIHQIQAEIYPQDNIHSIGNRLISQIASVYIKLIDSFENLARIPQPLDKKSGKLYKNRDFTPQSLRQIYHNLELGMVQNYLADKPKIPLFTNPILEAQ